MRRLLAILLLMALPLGAFERALPGYRYEFPRDHFSHPEFEVEWWYYTGNVTSKQGRPFGFELTFFRLAAPAANGATRPFEPEDSARSPWEADQIYLAHFTVSDIQSATFHKMERLNRAGPGLAGADTTEARVWNGNWEARWVAPENPLGAQRLRAVTAGFSIDLELTPQKPAVIHGENGVSQKAEGPGRASHYVSFTRLAAAGTLSLGGREYEVSGAAWMDHEFSTDSMGPEQAGWDWMSIQLENGSDLMLYRMRRKDGSSDPHSSGTFVGRDGKVRHLNWDEIMMEPGEEWESAETGGRYPVTWRVAVPSLKIELECRARFEEQEVVSQRGLGPTYWEGAVVYEGRVAGQTASGTGYLEMTGYDEPIRLGSDK